MSPMDELRWKDLPREIRSEELQKMLGASPAFCSWDPSNSTVTDLITRWPYLFSRPMGSSASRTRAIDAPNTPSIGMSFA